MAADIGPLALKMVTSTVGLTPGLKDAEKKLGASTDKMAKESKEKGKEAGSGWGSAFAGGIAAFISFESLKKAGEMFMKSMDALIQVDEKARTAGVSILEFRGAMLAAGTAGGAMETALRSLTVATGQLQAGMSGPAVEALRDLGLGQGASITQFARALQGLETPAQRSAAAMDVLGADASKLMHILEDPKALEKGASLAEKAGLGADQESIAAIKEAKMQIDALGESFMNNLALTAAPILKELSKNFDVLVDGIKIGAKVISYAGAYLVDAWKEVNMIWEAGKIAFQGFVGYVLKSITWLADKVNWLSEKLKAITGVDLGTFDVSSMQKDSKRLLDESGKNAKAFMDKWAVDKSAIGQVDKFWDANKKGVEDTTKAIAKAQAVVKAPFIDELTKKFKSLKDSLKDPLQAYKEAMGEMTAFETAGLFKNQADMQARLAAKTFATLQSAFPLKEFQPTGAMLAGGREAYSAIQAFRQAKPSDPISRLQQIMEEQKRIEEEQVRIGRLILEEKGREVRVGRIN